MTDLIQPEDRIFVKNQISKLDVSFMYISKNTIELWMQNSSWGYTKALLLGNVVKIVPKNREVPEDLARELILLLINQKAFNIRCMVFNKNFLRYEKLIFYTSNLHVNSQKTLVLEDLLLPNIFFPRLSFNSLHYTTRNLI